LFVYRCHSNIDFAENYIFPNFSPTPITGENLIAIGQGKKTLLRRLKNFGMAYEKLYRNTLSREFPGY